MPAKSQVEHDLDTSIVHRAQAKRLLGQVITSNALADRIVDCIILAAVSQMRVIMTDAASADPAEVRNGG